MSQLVHNKEILDKYQIKIDELLEAKELSGKTIDNWEQHVDLMLQAATDTIPLLPTNKSPNNFQDSYIQQLSKLQKNILIKINHSDTSQTARKKLKNQRNIYLHAIHKRLKDIKLIKIKSHIIEMEKYKDNSKMFIAAKQLFANKSEQLFLYDSNERYIANDILKAKTLTKYYSSIFYSEHHQTLSPFKGHPRQLHRIITQAEVFQAAKKLKKCLKFWYRSNFWRTD